MLVGSCRPPDYDDYDEYDDYGDENATDFVSEERYAKMYTNVPKKYHWGVMRATQGFARKVGVPLQITWMRDCYNWPAWYMIKPP